MTAMVNAHQAADVAAMASALHSIKGVAATLGARALSTYAADLEKRCKSDNATPDAIADDEFKKLVELAQTSTAALAQLTSTTTIATPSTNITLDDATINQQLNKLIELLKQDNMGALDLMDELQHQLPPGEKLHQLVEEINQLDFKNALITTSYLLKGQ
jgi:HPt (histidine-containing phosphotransfer) domain-containing protein